MELDNTPQPGSRSEPEGRCLYIVVFDGEPLIKIGISTGYSRIKGLRKYYPIDFGNSYLVTSENKDLLVKLERHLLHGICNIKISKYFERKYRVGISMFSPSGSEELRPSLCLPAVLEEIKREATRSGDSTIAITKGIALDPLPDKDSIGKKAPQEQAWFREFFRRLQDILLWIKDPSDNPVCPTRGVYLIKSYDRGFAIVCDGVASISVQRLMQVWVHPSLSVSLIEEIRDLGNGVYFLVASLRQLPSKERVLQLYPQSKWGKRFNNWLHSNLYWSLRPVVGLSAKNKGLGWRQGPVEGLCIAQLESVKVMLSKANPNHRYWYPDSDTIWKGE